MNLMCHFVGLGQVTADFGRVRNPKHFVQSGNDYVAIKSSTSSLKGKINKKQKEQGGAI